MQYSVGQKIGGRYEVHRIYGGEGHSGMGVVYICYDHQQNIVLALKTWQEGFFNDKVLVDHFKRGALAWIQLDRHPYIVKAYGVLDLADQLFLGLEYIAPDDADRNNLTHYLQSRIPLENALRWGMQFCDAMEHARNRGIVPHRDIKPDNLMVTHDGTLKVTDFDLSGIWDGSTAAPEVSRSVDQNTPGLSFIQGDNGGGGTLPWMAPEQFMGSNNVQSDIYSFGVVLYQMANEGGLPISPGEDNDWRKAHETMIPEKLASPLWPIIERSLKKTPTDRFGAGNPDNGFREMREALIALWKNKLPDQEVPVVPEGKALQAGDRNDRGISLSYLGLYDQALSEYKKALALQPDNAASYLNAGVALAGKGNTGDAEKAYRKAAHLDPEMAEAYNNLGLIYRKDGRLKEAEQAYRRAMQLKPELIGVYENICVLLSEDGRHEEAISLIKKAVKQDPINAGLHYTLGVSLEKAGQHEESLKGYAEAVQLRPDKAPYHYALGNAWRFLGDMNLAVAAWTKAAELDPEHSMARYNLGIAYERVGNNPNAYRYYCEAIEADPADAHPYYNLGLMLGQASLYGEGADAMEKFVELAVGELKQHVDKAREHLTQMRTDEETVRLQQEQHVEVIYNRGLAYLNLERLKEARLWIKRALQQRPDYPNALCGMGIYHEKLGDYAKAINFYRQSIDADPSYVVAWNNLGWANYKLGQYETAIQAYQKYISVAPEDQAEWVNDARTLIAKMQDSPNPENKPTVPPSEGQSSSAMADECWSLFKQGLYDEAAQILDTAIPLDPKNPVFQNIYGLILEAKGDLDGAMGRYLDAIELDPTFYDAQQNLGLVFKTEGDIDAALDHFRFLVDEFPDRAEGFYHLGLLLMEQEKNDEAISALNEYIDLAPADLKVNIGKAKQIIQQLSG